VGQTDSAQLLKPYEMDELNKSQQIFCQTDAMRL